MSKHPKRQLPSFLCALTAIATGLTFSLSANAQSTANAYPTKPIKLIAPVAAGGGLDNIARTLAEKLSRSIGQQVVVENMGGGGGSIASQAVAKAPADGYTLMVAYVGTHGTNPAVRRLPYDAIKDFTPIGMIGATPNVLIISPELPIKNFKEFVDYAKKNPGKLSYASFGNGTTAHFAGEMLKSMAGIYVVHIPYRGQGPALTDLIAGNVDLMFGNLPDFLPYIKSGKIKAIGTTYLTRAPLAPEIPTIAEQGFPTFETDSWYGIVAPSSMTKDAVDRMNQAINKALQDPAVKKNFGDRGIEIIGGTPAKFQEHIQSEIQKYERIVKSANMQPD